jgi:hypothetical protein
LEVRLLRRPGEDAEAAVIGTGELAAERTIGALAYRATTRGQGAAGSRALGMAAFSFVADVADMLDMPGCAEDIRRYVALLREMDGGRREGHAEARRRQEAAGDAGRG